jgi:hypothetical protein
MADLLNVNTGPERVEVIPVPIGTVQVAGAATAITAFIIYSNLPGAPTDTVIQINSLSDFVASFGTDANAGEGYWSVKGFYDNAGTGAPALIVNASPSSPSGSLVTFTMASDQVRNPAGDGAVAFPGMSTAAEGGAGYVVDDNFVMNDNILQGSMIIQRASSLGSVTVSSVVGNALTGSGFLSIGAETGDIIYDGTSNYLLTNVISDTEATVDRNGFNSGTVYIYGSSTAIILGNIHVASGTSSWAPAAPATSSGAGFLIYDDPSTPPQAINSLVENMLVAGSLQKQILNNYIVAGATVQFPNSTPTNFTYNPGTGVVTYSSAVTLTGVVVGSVFRDGAGIDYAITNVNSGAYQVTIVNNKTGATPASINTTAGANAGGSIRDGATYVNFVDTTFNLGTSVNIAVYQPAVEIETSAALFNGSAATYFVVTPEISESDYIGTAANGKGLNALNPQDQVDLICIPGVDAVSVKIALLNYVSVQRDDCFALLAVPSYVTSSSTDALVAQINIVSITNGSSSSILHLLSGTNLSQVKPNMVVEIGGALYPILNVDQADYELEVSSPSISQTGAATVNLPSAVTFVNTLVNTPAVYAAWYFNDVIVDNGNGGQVVVDPVGHVAGVMARIDANTLIGGVSHAPAGIQFAQLAGTIGLALNLSERLDGYPLRSNFINRITSFTGSGRVIFGGYTAGGNSVTPDEQLIQVMRSILFIKNSLEPGLRGFIWENFSPVTQQKVADAITNFMTANIYLCPQGLPQAQQFQVIEVTPTQTELNEGLLRVRLQVAFNTAVRFIEIDLEFPLPLSS